jgi:hypothetical protein
MPSQNCCVTHDEVRVVYYESNSYLNQVVYTVPAGKVFVLTAWTIVNESGQRVSVRLRRAKARVAYNRIWDPLQGHNHLTFPTGIVFGPEQAIELEAPVNSCQHFFYGYEHDAESP